MTVSRLVLMMIFVVATSGWTGLVRAFPHVVMAGLAPAIHVDPRDKPGDGDRSELRGSRNGQAGVVKVQLQPFPKASLTIESASGKHKFAVEVATTPAQMEQGLMFRRSMAPDSGMIFDFKTPSMATMWMKNTLIPLDMLFVDAQGRIVNIHERAVPESLDTIGAAAPVRAVVELNGGTVARLGIRPGDRVLFPIFGNAS
jgi:uncharacterized protein